MLARPAPRRRGQIALISVFALLTLLLVAAIVNASRLTVGKVDAQNAADAAAHAGAVEMARGLNAVAAVNHLITELDALDVLVLSFGGRELEENRRYTIAYWHEWDRLRNAYEKALKWSPVSLPAEVTPLPAGVTLAPVGVEIVYPLTPAVGAGPLGMTSKSGAAIGRARARLLD